MKNEEAAILLKELQRKRETYESLYNSTYEELEESIKIFRHDKNLKHFFIIELEEVEKTEKKKKSALNDEENHLMDLIRKNNNRWR